MKMKGVEKVFLYELNKIGEIIYSTHSYPRDCICIILIGFK